MISLRGRSWLGLQIIGFVSSDYSKFLEKPEYEQHGYGDRQAVKPVYDVAEHGLWHLLLL